MLVVNQFAQDRSVPGGTRHIELFSRLPGWDYAILAANRNDLTGERNHLADPVWMLVWVSRSGEGFRRITSWGSYAINATARGLTGRRPDIVYASSPQLLAGLSGLILAKLRRAHFIFEVRDLWPLILVEMGQLSETSWMYRALCWLESRLYDSAEAIVVLTPGVQGYLEGRGLADKVWLIPNGADPQDFQPDATREHLRKRFGFDGFVVAYAGAHGRANGLDLVLDAAAELRDELPDVLFVLAGDGPLKSRLITRAREEGLANVRFLDSMPKQEMPRLLGAVDVGLHVLDDVPLFRYGVSPNKLFDYMAAGLPVLTNTLGELAALVNSVGSGIAVPARDIAQGVRSMVSAGAGQRAIWGNAGRHFMATDGSRTAMARRLGQLLEEVSSTDVTSQAPRGPLGSPGVR